MLIDWCSQPFFGELVDDQNLGGGKGRGFFCLFFGFVFFFSEKPAHASGQVVIATPRCSQRLWSKTNPCMCICSSHWIRTRVMTPEVKGHSSNQLSHPSSALLARLHLACFAAHGIPACPRLFRRPGGSYRKGRSGWRRGIWICNRYT